MKYLLSIFLLMICGFSATARDMRGKISGIDCGDGTNISVLVGKKKIDGVCYEKWCDALCGEGTQGVRKRMRGRVISFKSRVVDTEEPGTGAIANEFYQIILE